MERENGSIININVDTSSIDELIHEVEVLKRKVHEIKSITSETHEPEKVCETCKNYLQHYVVDRKIHSQSGEELFRFLPTNCGHCVKPRIKTRKPGDKACIYWEESNNKIWPKK